MLNKERLYWTLQVGGWAAYFAMQIISIVLASGEVEIGTSRVIFFLFEALFGLLLTHFYRNYINERKWLSMSLARLIPHVFVAILIMSVAIYFLRVPVSWSLGLLVANAFDPRLMISGTLFYAFIFFLWSALHFIYNYFERYNKSLKLEASAKEIELKNLKSQLNPHFIFNALNSIRALVDENPGGAKLAINQLSALLRNSLVTEKKRTDKL